ncbi:MAG TPA: molybdopterin dehydrogenase [Deltaproteobacteria bacterium]|jgi:xanthine dehydrogenase YagS FAD-binding subunit|nr:molybdopterin dehydrogenase [Deltaproteobacteria bacterium]
MRSFRHFNARTVRKACSLLRDYQGRAVLNAGGTDLLSTLKGENLFSYPEAIINIKTIHGLDYIKEPRQGVRIGALAKLSDIAGSDLLRRHYPALAEAAHTVATPQIRNMATIGGNLCQDTRCWYYRYPRILGGPIQCLRKGSGPCLAVRGDNRYHAILDAKKCFAVSPSDTAVALTALGAHLTIVGPEGKRRIEVPELFTSLGLTISPYEMVTEIQIPKPPAPSRQLFLKYTLRKPVDFAIVSAASVITLSEGLCTDVSLVLGGVGPGPIRAKGAEEFLKGKEPDEATAEKAAGLALAGAKPLKMNGYKIDVARALIKRAITTT